jgi:proteic killer suppression protein
MVVTFATRKLQKTLSSTADRAKSYGAINGKIIGRRLDVITAATTLEDLQHVPGKFHPLAHNRKGQFSFHIEEPLRLIFRPDHDPLPLDANGNLIWAQVTRVEILEIVDYHPQK